jgi:hypothetical protein
MKTPATTLGTIALIFCSTGPAQAALALSPSNTNFQLDGVAYAGFPSGDYQCRFTITGVTAPAGAHKQKAGTITAISNSLKTCPIHFFGLPWTISLVDKTSGVVPNAGYGGSIDLCEAVTLQFTVSKKGNWVFTKAEGSCGFSGLLKPTPPIVISK